MPTPTQLSVESCAQQSASNTKCSLEYCPDSDASLLLCPVSSGHVCGPAVLVSPRLDCNWFILECQLAFRPSRRTDRAGLGSARHVVRPAPGTHRLATELRRLPPRQVADNRCALVDGPLPLRILRDWSAGS